MLKGVPDCIILISLRRSLNFNERSLRGDTPITCVDCVELLFSALMSFSSEEPGPKRHEELSSGWLRAASAGISLKGQSVMSAPAGGAAAAEERLLG